MKTRMPPLPCTVELGPWWCPPDIRLTSDWWFEWNDVRWGVPKGFGSDAASVPRWVRFPMRWVGLVLMAALALLRFGKLRSLRASVAHDWLYHQGCVPRRQADRVFRDLLAHDGVGLLGRWTAWAAVRVGGGGRYGQEE